MMDSLLRLVFVSVLVIAAWADIDSDVCSPVYESFGPVPPPLPVNFELKGSFVDYLNKSMGYEETYFDFDNLRAKHMILSDGIEKHLIFDYNASQVIEYFIIHPGSTVKQDPLAFGCSAGEIESSAYRYIFGYRFSPNGIATTMYDSAHALRFGGPYQFAYNGSSSDDDSDEDDDRGLKWNAFVGCVYEDYQEATALVRYKFSTEDMLTSGGNVRSDIDASGIQEPLSVPLAMDITGTAFFISPEGTRTKAAFNFSQGVSWFRANPIFDNKNLQSYVTLEFMESGLRVVLSNSSAEGFLKQPQIIDVFVANQIIPNISSEVLLPAHICEVKIWCLKQNTAIPPWLHCDNYRGWKSAPKFPMAFSTRMETTAYSQDLSGKAMTSELVSVEQLYYYYEKGLARRDFTPHVEKDSEIIAAFGNANPVKQVYDYMSLQIYTVNKVSGRCFSTAIKPDSHFSKPTDTLFTEMATPEELFLMQQEEMEYKGQYFARDIECDVWNGKQYDKQLNITFYKESYFTTNGWHSEVDENIEYRVPIKHSVISYQVTDEFKRNVVENNFFKFKAYSPVLVLFDISECVETTEHKYLAIKLNVPEGDPQKTLETYRFIFLESAQYYLATVSDLASPLRIQKLKLSITKSGVFLTFAMLEKPGVKDGILNPSKGVTVEDAMINLRKVIDEGNFDIAFVHPLSKEKVPVVAEPGNLYEWYPAGKMTSATPLLHAESQEGEPEDVYEDFSEHLNPVLHADAATEAPKKGKTGMSGGALAGLGIGMLLIGVAIGIAVMYLYFRKFAENPVASDYAMHTTN